MKTTIQTLLAGAILWALRTFAVEIKGMVNNLVAEIKESRKAKLLVSAVRGKFHVVANEGASGVPSPYSGAERVEKLALAELASQGYDITTADKERARAIIEALQADSKFPTLANDGDEKEKVEHAVVEPAAVEP